MDAAARCFERTASAIVGELQDRTTTNSEPIDRLARRDARVAREPEHVIRRQRDDLVVAAKPARIADVRELATTIHSNTEMAQGRA